MIHVTLNDGKVVDVPGNLVSPTTRDLLAPIIAAGEGNFPGALSAYRGVIAVGETAAYWSLWRGREAILFSGYAAADTIFSRRIWNLLEQAQHRFDALYPNLKSEAAAPRKVPSPPWMGSVVLPDFGWLASQDVNLILKLNLSIGLIINGEG